MLTTLRDDDTMLARFMKYVIATCHRKIEKRFQTKDSADYWGCFEKVKVKNDHFRGVAPRKRSMAELKNDRSFLIILGGIIPDYEKPFPNIANVAKEVIPPHNDTPAQDDTPPPMTNVDFELFNATTCEEYHSLFMDLMRKYKDDVVEIGTKAKKRESFEVTLDRAAQTGHMLLTMVKGRAFQLYLSTIAKMLSKCLSESKLVEAEKGDDEEHKVEERDDEEHKVKECDDEGDTNPMPLWNFNNVDDDLWKPFKSWVLMMLVQLDAADALCALAKRKELAAEAEIDVKIVYSSLVSNETIPLEVLLTQNYIPEAALDDLNFITNARLLNFVKTAKTLKDQFNRATKFKKELPQVSSAKSFIQEVLAETKKEHDEDSEERRDGNDLNKMVSARSHEILELLSPTGQDDAEIRAKFAELATELGERCARFELRFSDRGPFKGALHCEACLASILDKTTRKNIRARIDTLASTGNQENRDLCDNLSQILEATKDFERVVGVSKRCCPVCRRFLSFLSLDGNPRETGIVTSGFHNTITSCTLPEWTPEVWVDRVIYTFGRILRNELVKLSDSGSLNSYRSRRKSSGSGVSVGNASTEVGAFKDTAL